MSKPRNKFPITNVRDNIPDDHELVLPDNLIMMHFEAEFIREFSTAPEAKPAVVKA